MKVKMKVIRSYLILCDLKDCSPPGSSVHGILQARILEWVACCLLHVIFPTQGWRLGFQILYHLSHQGSPRILEWVAYPFSSRSSRPKNQTSISCIAGGFFISWATREALFLKAVLTATPVDCAEHLRVSTDTD